MTDVKTKVLARGVRGKVIAKYCGLLGVLLALLMLAPLAVALVTGNWPTATRLSILAVLLLMIGFPLMRQPAPANIQANEAMSITALAFLCAALLMSWPIQESGVGYADALFEAVSGVTTTGLSAIGSIDERSPAFLFTRAWMQWYGGLGFIVLSVVLLMGNETASRRLVGAAESGGALMVTVRTHALRTLIVYTCMTALGLLLVWLAADDIFTAFLYILPAVSTGGFSPHPGSLAELPSKTAAVFIMGISFLSAVSLPLYWKIMQAGWREGTKILLKDTESHTLLLACLGIGTLLGFLAWLNGTDAPWYHGFMTGFSSQTTTGFATLPVAELDATSKGVMILSMLVGGCVGSSAGGIKILRLMVLLRLFQLMLRRTSMPAHAVTESYLGEQKLETGELNQALQLILLFIALIFLSWLPFLAYGYEPLDALFEVVSACGTVGLSSGITGPGLEPLLKGILCFDMLAGRVEIIALLVVLYPPTWFSRREKT